MSLFFQLEVGYLGIALFILVITIFVSTRPFFAKGSWKKSVSLVAFILAGFILAHYFVTTNRMTTVENTFNNNGQVICESRMVRKVAQSVIIEKSNDWILEDHIFTSPNYERGFYTARCIKYGKLTTDK